MNILLHMCCSNCSIYPVRILRSEKHDIAGFWFNPNIHPYEEYEVRLDSLKRLAGAWKFSVRYEQPYSPEEYFRLFNMSYDMLTDNTGSKWLSGSHVPPYPERCRVCYQLRLEKTAAHAQKEGFDAFSTTLLISPYQDYEQIASEGKALADKYNIQFHLRDYRPHFREAMALSKAMGLYRQKYCGCIFSREERKERTKAQRGI